MGTEPNNHKNLAFPLHCDDKLRVTIMVILCVSAVNEGDWELHLEYKNKSEDARILCYQKLGSLFNRGNIISVFFSVHALKLEASGYGLTTLLT
jgi:hypothetical protein